MNVNTPRVIYLKKCDVLKVIDRASTHQRLSLRRSAVSLVGSVNVKILNRRSSNGGL
jgi:hypothetical protein